MRSGAESHFLTHRADFPARVKRSPAGRPFIRQKGGIRKVTLDKAWPLCKKESSREWAEEAHANGRRLGPYGFA